MGGLVADHVPDPGDTGPTLLGRVDLPAQDDREVQTLRVAGGDRAGRAHHRVRRGGDPEEAERPELVAPHPRPELAPWPGSGSGPADTRRTTTPTRSPADPGPGPRPCRSAASSDDDGDARTMRRAPSSRVRTADGKCSNDPHSLSVASRAPSASASSFAHWIVGWTRRTKAPCANPQSVPPITFSRPTSFASRTSRSATSSGCSTTFVWWVTTPGTRTFPSGARRPPTGATRARAARSPARSGSSGPGTRRTRSITSASGGS